MRQITVVVHDHVHCHVPDKRDALLLLPAFGYHVRGWRDSAQSTGPVSRQKFVFDAKHNRFLTGFLPRVQAFCDSMGYTLTLQFENLETVEKAALPHFDDITMRPDQQRLIDDFIAAGARGVLVAPTRTGKSVVMFGIVKSWPGKRFLVLAHTSSIVLQHYEDALRLFPHMRVGLIGAKSSDKTLSNLTISTWQSFKNLDPNEYADYFDGVLIDECHHVIDTKSNYANILQRLLCPIRCGFTATLPSEQKERLMLEGLIGPVVGQLTMKEAVQLDIISRPVVIIRRVPDNKKVREITGYKGAYREGVVRNKAFARMVLTDAMHYVQRGNSGLIFVWEKEHGNLLSDLADRLFDTYMPFVYSGTEVNQRNTIRKMLDKEPMIAIATACWREGITIPNLGAVLNAAGGKKELITLQSVGRGLGKTATKNIVRIHDYFNPNNVNFISHFGERICLYMDNGWLAGQKELADNEDSCRNFRTS